MKSKVKKNAAYVPRTVVMLLCGLIFGFVLAIVCGAFGGLKTFDRTTTVVHTWSKQLTVSDLYRAMSDTCWTINHNEIVPRRLLDFVYLRCVRMHYVTGDGNSRIVFEAPEQQELRQDTSTVIYYDKKDAETQLCLQLKAKVDSLCGE